MTLHEDSRHLVTINTRWLYQYNRLPFGVVSAPALFQHAMDTLLQGIPNVLYYIADILVTGSTLTQHMESLEEVLKRLANEGITVKYSKCEFLTNQVEYLGYVIDEKGLYSSDKKLQAILSAPVPQNTQQLQSLLGLVNYYGKFAGSYFFWPTLMTSLIGLLNYMLMLMPCQGYLSPLMRKLIVSVLIVFLI